LTLLIYGYDGATYACARITIRMVQYRCIQQVKYMHIKKKKLILNSAYYLCTIYHQNILRIFGLFKFLNKKKRNIYITTTTTTTTTTTKTESIQAQC
jgi:hypothetical protein